MGKEITQSGRCDSSTKQKNLRIRFPRRFAEIPHLQITYISEGASKSIQFKDRSTAWFEVSPNAAATIGKVVDKPCTIDWTATGEVKPRWHALIPVVSITGGLLGIYVTLAKIIPPDRWEAWLRPLTSLIG